MLDIKTKFEQATHIQRIYTRADETGFSVIVPCQTGVISHKNTSSLMQLICHMQLQTHLTYMTFSCWLSMTINLWVKERTPEAKAENVSGNTGYMYVHTRPDLWKHRTIHHHLADTLFWQVMDVWGTLHGQRSVTSSVHRCLLSIVCECKWNMKCVCVSVSMKETAVRMSGLSYYSFNTAFCPSRSLLSPGPGFKMPATSTNNYIYPKVTSLLS